jgi:hypothetical protein
MFQICPEPFWLKCSLTWTRLVSSDTSLIEAMAAMRIILLASALTSGRAATAIHVVETYSASDCAPANLVNEMMSLGGCHGGTEATCNATHYQKMDYYSGDAQCAGTPDGGGTTIEYSSACTQLTDGAKVKWVRVKCNAAVGNPIHVTYVTYTDDTCATMKDNGMVLGRGRKEGTSSFLRFLQRFSQDLRTSEKRGSKRVLVGFQHFLSFIFSTGPRDGSERRLRRAWRAERRRPGRLEVRATETVLAQPGLKM